jgi:hypothetical protein
MYTDLGSQTDLRVITCHDRAGSQVMAHWLRRERLRTVKDISLQEGLELYKALAKDYTQIGAHRASIAMRKEAMKVKSRLPKLDPSRLPAD